MAVFEHEKCFIWVFLVFSFLVFSVFKYLKSSFSSNFPDLEMLQFWSVNYLCQACKLYFHFGHVQNFGQYVFLVNSESVLRLVFVKYILYSHFTQNCSFLYFLEAKNPCFVTKNCSKYSYICVFILPKKQRNWFYKNHHNSGMVGRRKLSGPS